MFISWQKWFEHTAIVDQYYLLFLAVDLRNTLKTVSVHNMFQFLLLFIYLFIYFSKMDVPTLSRLSLISFCMEMDVVFFQPSCWKLFQWEYIFSEIQESRAACWMTCTMEVLSALYHTLHKQKQNIFLEVVTLIRDTPKIMPPI